MSPMANERTCPSFAEFIWPQIDRKREIVLILVSSWLVALTAQIVIPLQPVPITGQTFGVLLIGALLGRKRGTLALLTYLAQGGMGLPVFAGGTGGLARLAGPTGGYLIGFVVAAFVVGWLSEKGWDRRFTTTAIAMLIGNAVIYALGLPWLAAFVGWEAVLRVGLFPFIGGDLLKVILAAVALPQVWTWANAKEVG
jgi:biotin transport system substrate-specific component